MYPEKPREGYGYGIIRVTNGLALHLSPFVSVKGTNGYGEMTQQYMEEYGVFDDIRSQLKLPPMYTILALYTEPHRFTWCILIEGPDIPVPDEGELLPVLRPVYAHSYDMGKDLHHTTVFVRMDISEDLHLALRAD